jgi:pyrroloquinoline quinone biosynthesis protein B
MAEFLKSNAPWDLLVRLQNVVLHPIQPDIPVPLGEDLTITPFLVPHRAEYTDTFGFRIEGPQRSVLYIPDIDKWELWERSIEEELAAVDVALLDGTFFANGEIPGRDMSEIPHPFIEESLRRFAPLPEAEHAKIHFTHLNHTNPATDPEGEAQQGIEAAGMAVASEAQVIAL